jgi:hypothetical protein
MFNTSNRVKGSGKVNTVKMEIVNRSEEDNIKRHKKALYLGITACIAFLFILENIIIGGIK